MFINNRIPLAVSKWESNNIFIARSSYASRVLGIVILSVRLSVRPSVTRVLCDKTKEHTAELLTPHETVINLVLWHHDRFHLKFALKWPTPFEKRRLRPISAYNVWTIRASEKCSIIANRKSTTRFPTSYRWSAYVIPNSPKGWLKRIYRFFVNKIQVQSNIVCYKDSLCENFQRQSCSRTIPLSNGV